MVFHLRLLDEKLSDLHRCSNLNTVKQIQAQVVKHDVHQDPYVAPKLVAAFSVSRHLPSAVNAFNLVTNPNAHLYNTLSELRPKTRLTLPSHLKPSSRYKGTMFFQIASPTRVY
ncbi:hypothetical protein HN51_041079 [Arachis hypogaea]